MTKYTPLRSVLIVLLTVLAQAVHAADVPISHYDQAKNDKIFHLYIAGVKSGLDWANVDLVNAGKPRLYCEPMDKRTTTEETLQLVDRYVNIVRKDPVFLSQSPEAQASYPIPLILKDALKKEYPCGKELEADKRAVYSSAPMQQPAPVIQPVPVYKPAPLPTMPSVPFPSAPGRTTTICRTLSNGTVVCN